jgi:hypothetical protein
MPQQFVVQAAAHEAPDVPHKILQLGQDQVRPHVAVPCHVLQDHVFASDVVKQALDVQPQLHVVHRQVRLDLQHLRHGDPGGYGVHAQLELHDHVLQRGLRQPPVHLSSQRVHAGVQDGPWGPGLHVAVHAGGQGHV